MPRLRWMGRPAGFVHVRRHQRSRLIRWEFLPDLPCGFRQIWCAFRTSSHSKFNPALYKGITQHTEALQIVCNTSHTILYQTRQTSVERFLFRPAPGIAIFDRCAGTVSGLYAPRRLRESLSWNVAPTGSFHRFAAAGAARIFCSGWLECYDQGFGGIAQRALSQPPNATVLLHHFTLF